MRLKAGALQLVLFIGVLVCVLLMAFVLLISTKSQFQAKQNVLITLIKQGQNLPSTPPSHHWGLFEKSTQNPSFKKVKWKGLSLVGSTAEPKTALYLKDQGFPVVLAGNARIEGNAFLPERGIKRGNIRGLGYLGDYLVYGDQKQSRKSLPQLSPGSRDQLEDLYGDYSRGIRLTNIPAELSASYTEETQRIEGDMILLNNQKLKGNILVQASNKIIVGKRSELFGVVLIAPKIEIQSDVYGAFQAFATEQIQVGNRVELAFPSVLCVYQQSAPPEETVPPIKLALGEGSNIRGSLLYIERTGVEKIDHNPDIQIPENSRVDGQVYCQGSLDLQGQVNGIVYTSLFQTFQNGSNYINHLFNGQINRAALPEEYAGISIGNQNQKARAQWLD
ncbi:hypothetical protein [Aureicoccus marinus]|uniref:Uncharacterized protein n=1 Tax=Aureicoccus marinus TaxID=754435 RepID=A0A2S7T5W6_9FLAO|nr:hypothetical protein [Aureicoccus marinus]PQJ15322.1 hypothetical protein BST99_05840 [Aureicoccus marinus]